MRSNTHPFERAAPTGRRVAVVGAGPAGLACAHGLARRGHDVTIYEARDKPGGLNEYGIAAYKTVDDFAQAEVNWLMQIGGISVRTGRRLGVDLAVETLRSEYDAVFLGVGLAGINELGVEGADRQGVRAAVDFIAELRQAEDPSALPVGRDVVVSGGGMTAIAAGVQSRLLGAATVTIVYRRGRGQMGASRYEQDLAAENGARIVANARPVRVLGNGTAREIEFEYTEDGPEGLRGTGQMFRLLADQVLRAIGQRLEDVPEGLEVAGGKIAVSGPGRTSLDGVWAGGDCAAGGDDLTVTAVAQGRDAAADIDGRLRA
jgi:glutamate synthase (NADPH/NADH) small chain